MCGKGSSSGRSSITRRRPTGACTRAKRAGMENRPVAKTPAHVHHDALAASMLFLQQLSGERLNWHQNSTATPLTCTTMRLPSSASGPVPTTTS